MKYTQEEKLINKAFNCDIMEETRDRKNVDGRIAFSKILREERKLTFVKIGKVLGKNHASIMHYLKKHKDLMQFNEDYRLKYNSIKQLKEPNITICNECVYVS